MREGRKEGRKGGREGRREGGPFQNSELELDSGVQVNFFVDLIELIGALDRGVDCETAVFATAGVTGRVDDV